MNEEQENSNGKIVIKHYVIDPDFKDPLDVNNLFEEIEVEEFKYYYDIHLGIPQNDKEDE